jgi:hypothetical protein
MSNAGDKLQRLAQIVDHIEDERGAQVRDIGITFVKRARNPLTAAFGDGKRVPVFDLQITPSDDFGDSDDELSDDVDEEDVEIDLEDEVESRCGISLGDPDE